MTTGAFSQNTGKLFSKLKLVTDNFSLYAAANWEAIENLPIAYIVSWNVVA